MEEIYWMLKLPVRFEFSQLLLVIYGSVVTSDEM